LAKNDAKDDAIWFIKYLLYLNKDNECTSLTNTLISVVICFYRLYDYQCFAYLNQQYGNDERAKEEKKTGSCLFVYTYILSIEHSIISHQQTKKRER
jgi:hypothetical protein